MRFDQEWKSLYSCIVCEMDQVIPRKKKKKEKKKTGECFSSRFILLKAIMNVREIKAVFSQDRPGEFCQGRIATVPLAVCYQNHQSSPNLNQLLHLQSKQNGLAEHYQHVVFYVIFLKIQLFYKWKSGKLEPFLSYHYRNTGRSNTLEKKLRRPLYLPVRIHSVGKMIQIINLLIIIDFIQIL